MQRFRKLPVVVEAMVWDNADSTLTALKRAGCSCYAEDGQGWLRISTLEGTMEAHPGDYIVKGVKGEFYPCKPDIFAATYQPEASAAPVEGVDLEEVLRLDREGTPGPWHMRAAETENGYGTHAVSPDSAIEDGLSPTDLVLVGRTITIGVSGHDAALIATYRTAAPALARALARALMAERAHVREVEASEKRLMQEAEELRLTLAAEQGKPEGAPSEGWTYTDGFYERWEKGKAVVQHLPALGWKWRLGRRKFRDASTARAAMLAADAAVVVAKIERLDRKQGGRTT